MAASPLASALLSGGGMNPAAFLDPTIAAATPDLQLGQQMIHEGLSTAPASPWQALARIAQAGAGTYLQRGAISDLAKAYAHSADNMAPMFPAGSPVGDMLRSADPTVRMMGLQMAQKAGVLQSEPYTLGQNRYVGNHLLVSDTTPESPEGKLQRDLNIARGGQPSAPGAAPLPISRTGVPLGPPRMGGIESVVGMGPGGPGTPSGQGSPAATPAGVPMTAPNFNDRFSAASPSGVRPTSLPQNPLQGAIEVTAQKAAAEERAKNPALIDRAGGVAAAENPALIARAGATEAAKNPALVERAGATKQAEANVEYGGLIGQQPAIKKGPGGTEALTTTHGTLVPALADQAPLPKTPAEAKTVLADWQKTKDGWHASLQPGYQAEQRLGTIADAFKQIKTGEWATDKAHFAAMMKSLGMDPAKFNLDDPKSAQLALHENIVETLQQLKATNPRFAQMEFRMLSGNKEHPNLQPEANLQMLAEDIGQLRQSRDLPRDFVTAQQHGWRDPQSFEQAWLRQNPIKGYVDKVKGEIGPLKGMAGNDAAPPNAPQISDKAAYDRLAKGAAYVAPDGSIRHKQ